MFDAINRMENVLTRLTDGTNGHGVVRRQEFSRLETHVERIDGKVDRISEQLAAVRATCDLIGGATLAEVRGWVQLLVTYDSIIVAVSVLTFGYVVEE